MFLRYHSAFAVQGCLYHFIIFFAWMCFCCLHLKFLFHKRSPTFHLVTCKETRLGSETKTPRRTEKAKRRETGVQKEKAKANERARARRDQGRRIMRRTVFMRKASLVCPRQCLSICPKDIFSPQSCLILRAL